ncbi:hypothetical protein A2971_04325 [Candidatus Gottesmanbacteria bacterium RIFCSPLOWO2_01_FULL_46_21]|uniref:Glycoside hydrolase family 5 domain-containing protein n=1 Tax=Candidatus Gottesmanbacteria bacterium RIFCSPLOWO2_01_FULL_46_21 TaxID=1798393 RepID=A0A1F6AZ57_9BACT|nr:MAG: hypothetical protein A2971_04325 [Candidatus Gottesmanbacteria bacterium RIFCSPLOWO2_01_FULL_46_21]
MRIKRFITVCAVLGIAAFAFSKPNAKEQASTWWVIQSIDTMKYSRDPSREKLKDPSYDRVIDGQVRQIAETGATHVAIGTPYDEEFVPIMKRWVSAARRYGLNVWFRGNFSGWEKWFGYASISRDEHKIKTAEFIRNHADLFADGDIFTPCPECENGGPGDPRRNGDVAGHKVFLKELHQVAKDGFSAIGKNVESGLFSMNGDVARLIMDPETTKALGGVVVVDHYVASPKQLKEDIIALAKQSGGQIVLGEFGVPIPDLHGNMNEEAQAAWIGEALRAVSGVPEVIGINYWTSVGGSTRLWEGDGKARLAVQVLKLFFTPKIVRGTILNEIRQPIAQSIISSTHRYATSGRDGKFVLPYLDERVTISVQAPGYDTKQVQAGDGNQEITVPLVKREESFWFKIQKFLHRLTGRVIIL